MNVRLVEPGDAEQFAAWLATTENNALDLDIAGYRNLRILAVGAPDLFVPFHPVLAVESLAHKPGITPLENARALKAADSALNAVAQQYGMAEIYWMCKDESLIQFAARHGYEVVPLTLLRKKVQ